VNVDKCDEEIRKLNEYYNNAVTASFLYADYFRLSYQLEPSELAVQYYRSLLLSRPYRMLKRSQLTGPPGSWPNPDLEIYVHFVKLMACGASIFQINDIYDSLTSGDDAIDKGAIPQIDRYVWLMFHGWIQPGLLDYSDLGATNLDSSRLVTSVGPFGPIVAKTYLTEAFAQAFGYWAPRSSSCLAGITLVLLAEGGTRQIRDIAAGDTVLSGSGPRRVAFVSKPPVEGRSLFSYKSLPDVLFTDTHPVFDQGTLAFVNLDNATALNPTWQALRRKQINEALDTHPAQDVYDLVFEDAPSATGPASYFVQSSNGSKLEVASEAPIMSWFPHVARFYKELVANLVRLNVDFTGLSALLDSGMGCFTDALRALSPTAARVWPRTAPTDPLTLQSLLLQGQPSQAQSIATFVEKMVSLLSRSISHEIHSGWMYLSHDATQHLQLQLHSIAFFPDSPAWPLTSAVKYKVTVNGKLLEAGMTDAEPQGQLFWEVHQPIIMSESPAYQVEVEVSPMPVAPSSNAMETTVTLRGQGQLFPECPSTMLLAGTTNQGTVDTESVTELLGDSAPLVLARATSKPANVYASLEIGIATGFIPDPDPRGGPHRRRNMPLDVEWTEDEMSRWACGLAMVFADYLHTALLQHPWIPPFRKP
jgi:hypothetical protein